MTITDTNDTGSDSYNSSVESIADSLVDSMPEVQPHAIAQEREQLAAAEEEHADLKDRDGNSFDRDIHRTTSDGSPVLSAKGNLIRKPGRKAGESPARKQSVIADAPADRQAAAVDSAQTRAAGMALGKVAANTMISLCTLISDEWQPIKDETHGVDERAYLEGAFGEYFVATGKTDMPPHWALAIAVSAYAIPRVAQPKTRSKLSKAGGWIKRKYANWRLRKTGLVAVDKKDRETDN